MICVLFDSVVNIIEGVFIGPAMRSSSKVENATTAESRASAEYAPLDWSWLSLSLVASSFLIVALLMGAGKTHAGAIFCFALHSWQDPLADMLLAD